MEKYLTADSLAKYRKYKPIGNASHLQDDEQILYNKMQKAFRDCQSKFSQAKRENVVKKIQQFDREFNTVSDSILQQQAAVLPHSMNMILHINEQKITIHCIYSQSDILAACLHALECFCLIFPANYDGLTIYMCLDDTIRNLDPVCLHGDHVVCHAFQEVFTALQEGSGAFNVSGVTYPGEKVIILTRKQEIIKLLFHEMIHYAGIDKDLRYKKQYNFSVRDTGMQLNEAYTEMLAVILSCMYYSTILERLGGKNICSRLLATEREYSVILVANVLKLYRYTIDNYRDFFVGAGEKMYNPIMVWEYIILRAVAIGKAGVPLPSENLFQIDEVFLKQVGLAMETEYHIDYSYMMTDLDWPNVLHLLSQL